MRSLTPGCLHSTTPVCLSGDDLTIDQVVAVARYGAAVELDTAARARMRAARVVVEQALVRGDAVYGMTTGLGPLARLHMNPEQWEEALIPTIVGHSVTNGEQLDTATVRAMMLARANSMAKGGVGVRVEVVHALVAMLNEGVHPIVHHGGSVGEADLAEMAQIAQVLIGLGEAEFHGRRLPGNEALAAAGLRPMRLQAKEALGMISANGITLGQGSLVLADLDDALYTFAISSALALEGYGGNLSIIHPVAARLKPHPGQRRAADLLRHLLEGSYLWDAGMPRNLQDPLSFRCIPQTHGACYDADTYVRRMMEIELNAAGDNPLVSVEDQSIISVGNFDVLNLAIGFDTLRIALAQVLQIANERVQKQLWSHFSDLPTGLRLANGPQSGLLPLARSCAALTAEARLLANPVSLTYRAQIAEGIEDQGSMAPLGVRKLQELLRVASRLAALELIVAARAIDLRGQRILGRGTRVAYDVVRSYLPADTPGWETGIEPLVAETTSGRLAARIRDALDREEVPAIEQPLVLDLLTVLPLHGSSTAAAALLGLSQRAGC